MPVRCELLRDTARFHALEPAWQALWQQANASIFQSHAWIAACLSDHERLNVALAWQGDRLLGILPLVIRYRHGIRVLEWAGQSFSDYCDAIIESPAKDIVLEVMWRYVNKAGGFDVVWLKQISPSTYLYPLAQRMNGRSATPKTEICLQIANRWPTGQEWFKTLNKKTKNDHLRGKRILATMGDITFREYPPDESLESILDWAVKLKKEWSQAHGLTAVMFENGTNKLPAMVQALAEIDVLKIFLLECGSVPIAISINAIHDDRMLAFFATYDPAYERGSPGIVLMTEYTIWAFDRGITVVDYLRGEEPYKFKFANTMVPLTTFSHGRSLRGKLALAVYQWQKPIVSALPELGTAYLSASGKSRVAS